MFRKGLLYPLPDKLMRSLFEASGYNVVSKTNYSPVLAGAAILSSSKVNWSVEDCPGWYSNDIWMTNERELPPTHLGCRNFSG